MNNKLNSNEELASRWRTQVEEVIDWVLPQISPAQAAVLDREFDRMRQAANAMLPPLTPTEERLRPVLQRALAMAENIARRPAAMDQRTARLTGSSLIHRNGIHPDVVHRARQLADALASLANARDLPSLDDLQRALRDARSLLSVLPQRAAASLIGIARGLVGALDEAVKIIDPSSPAEPKRPVMGPLAGNGAPLLVGR
jgi:hypothetical protein